MIGHTPTEINRNNVNVHFTKLRSVNTTKRMSWFSKRRFGNI